MRLIPLAALTALIAGCGRGTPDRIDGGTTVHTNEQTAVSEDVVDEDPVVEKDPVVEDGAPRGRSFDDTSTADAAPSTAEASSAPPSIGGGDPTLAFNNVAPALRADPGLTAAGTIEGLVTFGDLSLVGVDLDALLDYLYKPDTDKAKAFEFPDKVKVQAGEGKALVGYMIPLEYKPKTDDIIIFMLVRDLSTCCFGGVPRPDEWVYVEMRGENVAKLFPYVPVVVRGELVVGRLEDEFGFATGVYTVRADSVEAFVPPGATRR